MLYANLVLIDAVLRRRRTEMFTTTTTTTPPMRTKAADKEQIFIKKAHSDELKYEWIICIPMLI